MMPRPGLLFLAQSLPYPPHSGVQSRTYNVMRQLQREFDVTLLPFARRNHHPDATARSAAAAALAERVTRVLEPVPIASEYSRIRQLRDHALSILSGRPYIHYQYESDAYAEQLDAVLSTRDFDMVHVDSLDLIRFVDRIPEGVPVACTHHDVESQLIERKASRIESHLLRRYVRHQAARVREVERTACPDVALNLMMSEADAAKLREIAPGARTTLVPNGVDTEYFAPSPGGEPLPGRVLFIGPTFMFANRDAVEFFLSSIWPRLRGEAPDATFELVGRNAPEDRARYEGLEAVIATGFAPDVREPMERASCSVVPIRVGGGTRIKILESWAMEVPVVSTSVGCEGLEAEDGHNILIRDDPDDFADAVARVLGDDALRRRLGVEGRRTVERLYSWDRIGEGLRESYRELLEAARSGDAMLLHGAG